MYIYSTLENTDIKTLHQAFLEAFSDYQVKINLSLLAFQLMMQRRGYSPEISLGAFKEYDNNMVGFILNGLRMWDGKLTAYDTGTGVALPYRKQGITGSMFKNVMEVLEQKNAEQYLLEVLKENTVAFELYKKQGFEVTREFSCFAIDKRKYTQEALTCGVEYATKIEPREWEQLKLFWDFSPSWQNSIDSVDAVQNEFIYALVRSDEKIVGYGIVGRKTGDVPQIAVHRNYRHEGIAGNIVAALLKSTEAGRLSVVNVDDACGDMKSFLCKLGFEQTVGQYELVLPLTCK